MTDAFDDLGKLEMALAQRDELAGALGTALRQWEMYADMYEGRDEFRFIEERSPEADLFRECKSILRAVSTPSGGDNG